MNKIITAEMGSLSPFWNEADHVPLEMAKSHSLQHTWLTKGCMFIFPFFWLINWILVKQQRILLSSSSFLDRTLQSNAVAKKEIRLLSSNRTIPQSALLNLISILCFLICMVISFGIKSFWSRSVGHNRKHHQLWQNVPSHAFSHQPLPCEKHISHAYQIYTWKRTVRKYEQKE